MLCPAPINSRWFGSDGTVKACCVSDSVWGNLNYQDLSEIENSPAKQQQVFWLSQNIAPKECNFCVKTDLDNKYNPIGFSKRFGKKPKIKFMDLSWSNRCNFACVHCVPRLSSTIQKQYKDIWPIITGNDDDFDKDFTDNNANRQKLKYILDTPSIELIHLNGGEPLLQPETWELLEKLKVQKREHTKIWLHTNGSVQSYKGVDLLEYLKGWKGPVHITMSHDHYGARGEWFRYGYRDDIWLETFQRWSSAKIKITVQTTVNVLNILTLDELWQWYDSCGVLDHADLSFSLAVDPAVWSIYNLPSEYLKSVLGSYKFPQLHSNNWNYQIRKLLKNIHQTNATNFKSAVDALDKKRKTNFLDCFPELTDLYLSHHLVPQRRLELLKFGF